MKMARLKKFFHKSRFLAAAALTIVLMQGGEVVFAGGPSQSERTKVAASEVSRNTAGAAAMPDVSQNTAEGAAMPDVSQNTTGGTSKRNNVTSKVRKGKDDFTTRIDVGIDGMVFYDSVMEMRVGVTSKKDFTGSIYVVPVESDYSYEKIVAYGEKIALARDNEKVFAYTLKPNSTTGVFLIRIWDEKDSIVYEERVTVTYTNQDEQTIMGILSEDYSGLAYFDKLTTKRDGYEAPIGIVELTEKNFPESASAFSNVKFLLIDNFDTAKLSKEQYECIKSWVLRGGTLLLGMGPNYQNVMHCFTDDFLTGTFGALEQKEVTWSEDLVLPGVNVLSFAADGAHEMSVYGTEGLVYRKSVGNGSVVMLAFDPAMEPFASYDDRQYVMELLLEQLPVMDYYDLDIEDHYLVSQVLGSIETGKKPSAVLFLLLFLFYAVVGGPVLYLVLKAAKKQEKIWLAIPLTAVVFTGIVYLIGLTYRVTHPFVSAVSIITPGENVVSETTFVRVTCPKIGEYEVPLETCYDSIRPRENYDYDYSAKKRKEGDYDYLVERGNKGLLLHVNTVSTFDSNDFTVDRERENDFAGAKLDMHCYTNGFSGTITNDTAYDWSGTVAVFEGKACYLGDVKKGETVTVDRSMVLTSSSYSFVDTIFQNQYSWTEIYQDPKINHAYNIAEMMGTIYRVNENNGATGQGMVWAKLEGYLPEVMADTKMKTYGEGVLCLNFTGDYEDVAGVFYPDIRQFAVYCDGEWDKDDETAYTDVIFIYFLEDLGITKLVNRDFGVGIYDWDEPLMQVGVLNPETGDYDLIFEDSGEISMEELSDYMIEGMLTMKYILRDGSDVGSMPAIAAEGEE